MKTVPVKNCYIMLLSILICISISTAHAFNFEVFRPVAQRYIGLCCFLGAGAILQLSKQYQGKQPVEQKIESYQIVPPEEQREEETQQQDQATRYVSELLTTNLREKSLIDLIIKRYEWRKHNTKANLKKVRVKSSLIRENNSLPKNTNSLQSNQFTFIDASEKHPLGEDYDADGSHRSSVSWSVKEQTQNNSARQIDPNLNNTLDQHASILTEASKQFNENSQKLTDTLETLKIQLPKSNQIKRNTIKSTEPTSLLSFTDNNTSPQKKVSLFEYSFSKF